MSKYVIDSSTLTSIADAVRDKTGTTDPIKVSDIPTAISNISGGVEPVITELTVTQNGTYTASDGVDGYSPVTVNVPQDGSPPASAFVISGDCDYRFSNEGWNWFIEKYGNLITTNISDASYMFINNSEITEIPFDLNFDSSSSYHNISNIFNFCNNLTQVHKLNNVKVYDTDKMFYYCHNLRTIPDDIANTWDWSYLENTSSYSIGNLSYMFFGCYSLRSFPMNIIKSGNPRAVYEKSNMYYSFANCHSLDELINLPIPYTKATWSNNAFGYTFYYCSRLKDIIFKTNDDGTPIIMKWKKQTIELSHIGYCMQSSDKERILNYNSGITADKEVTDDASYQALKNDPDWFTCNRQYSRYNHDSAVRTINSLPDTSAYLATAGGTNTIVFRGQAGSATDGGAINTLTESEIAVATAKGWTVSLV